MARRPILHSDKHEITWSNLGQNASTVQVVDLAIGVPPATKDQAIPSENIIGSRLGAIYFEFHFSAAQTGNINVIHWEIDIKRTGQTKSNPNVYYQTDRAQTIKRGMEMLPTSVSTVFKRIFVVRIPRIYQRMRDDTIVRFKYIASSTQTINACGFAIYKEYT